MTNLKYSNIKSILKVVGILVLSAALVIGCKTKYDRVVEREMSKGVRHDSLFLGLHFGMERDEFYRHCRILNKQKKITQGKRGSVYYPIQGFRHATNMNFSPSFDEEKIYEMQILFDYRGWAPWNKDLSPEALMEEVLELMKDWYGPDFFEIEMANGDKAYAKVDGNRRIIIYRKGERHVKVVFSDLYKLKEMEKLADSNASEKHEKG